MNLLGRIFGEKPEPVSALQVKELHDQIMHRVAHADPKVANQWLDYLMLMLSLPEEEMGSTLDLLLKLKNKDAWTAQGWSDALKRMLRKEVPWPDEKGKSMLWLRPQFTCMFTDDGFSVHKKTLYERFTVERTAKNLVEQLDNRIVKGVRKFVIVRPDDLNYRSDVRVADFIEHMIATYPQITLCPKQGAVQIRVEYTDQPCGQDLYVATEVMKPTISNEHDIFRISHYTNQLKKKKKISSSSSNLSLAAFRVDKYVPNKTQFLFQLAA